MDITFLKDWKNPLNGKTYEAGKVIGIHYKTAEALIEEGVATIKGNEAVILKKILPTSIDEFTPANDFDSEEY